MAIEKDNNELHIPEPSAYAPSGCAISDEIVGCAEIKLKIKENTVTSEKVEDSPVSEKHAVNYELGKEPTAYAPMGHKVTIN